MAFSGITAHYILDWKLIYLVLGCIRFKGRHTAEKIYQHYEDIILQFGLGNKVRHIVTDTASNMVKAFSLPGYEEEIQENEIISDEEDDEHDLEECDSESSTLIDQAIPADHHGCFAHKLQLVIKDGFKQASQIERIIRKCPKFVSHTKKSTIASEHLENEKALQPANTTRWNSRLKMLHSILSISSDKLLMFLN